MEEIIKKYNIADIDNILLKYEILEFGKPILIKYGKSSSEYRNMYYKVKNRITNDIHYIMNIKQENNDLYTKFSCEDLDKVLTRNKVYYINGDGYISIMINKKSYYLHQLIMNIHDIIEYNEIETTIDHINRDKLDNRRENLRLASMSLQNTNRDKSDRRCDAIDLPIGINQKDIPKYVTYRLDVYDPNKHQNETYNEYINAYKNKDKKCLEIRKKILDENILKYREFFYIEHHPNQEKLFESSKSNKISLIDKINECKLYLQLLNNEITTETYNKSKIDKLDLPKYISISTDNRTNKLVFIFDMKNNDKRYNYKKTLQSQNIQTELNIFIDKINKKYSELKMDKYKIENIDILQITNENISEIKNNFNFSYKLPPNFTCYKEKDNMYFQYQKVINKKKYNCKSIVKTNSFQSEFDNFIIKVNKMLKENNLNLQIEQFTLIENTNTI